MPASSSCAASPRTSRRTIPAPGSHPNRACRWATSDSRSRRCTDASWRRTSPASTPARRRGVPRPGWPRSRGPDPPGSSAPCRTSTAGHRFWDQEDPWGPWQTFRHAAEHDPDHTNFMVAGPWYHGQWRTPKADSIGVIALGGHETAREFRETIEAPFFRYYLHGRGEKPTRRATTFQSGANRWRTYAAWPPRKPSRDPVNRRWRREESMRSLS